MSMLLMQFKSTISFAGMEKMQKKNWILDVIYVIHCHSFIFYVDSLHTILTARSISVLKENVFIVVFPFIMWVICSCFDYLHMNEKQKQFTLKTNKTHKWYTLTQNPTKM